MILFAGSAKPRGPFHVTMDNNDAIEAAHAFAKARILAVHNDGWAHFTESQADLACAFERWAWPTGSRRWRRGGRCGWRSDPLGAAAACEPRLSAGRRDAEASRWRERQPRSLIFTFGMAMTRGRAHGRR